METRITMKDGTLYIKVPKELDHHAATEIKNKADSLVERNSINMILFDFGETEFMDSSGIGMIMGRYKLMHYMGGRIGACNLKERVKKIFCMSGLETIVELVKE